MLIAFGIVSAYNPDIRKPSAKDKLEQHQEKIPDDQYDQTIARLDELEG
jgi:hypothetical protein